MPSHQKSTAPQLPFWPAVLVVVLGIPALFYFRFGKVDEVAVAFTGFLLLLLFGVQFIPKLNTQYGKEQEAIKVAKGRFDWLGGVWLMAIPFAPFLLWVVSSFAVLTLSNWRMFLGVEAGICVVIPVICVLPLLRYLRGKAAPYALLILVVGTAFPVSVGWHALRDFIQGTVKQQVHVTEVYRVHQTYKYKDVETDVLSISLDDGRKFEGNINVITIKPGSQEITFLAHQAVILDSK